MRPALVLAFTLLPCLHALAASTDACVPAPDVDVVDIHALQEKAAAGDVCASLTVARFSDSQQQYMNSRYYYLLAAKQGDLSSDQRLLELYRTTSENIVQQAIYEEWLEKAAANGETDAIAQLDDSTEPWYTRAENWGKRQLITDEARCPDVALAVEP